MRMRLTRALLLLSMLGLIGGSAAAKPWWMRGIDSNDTDFLPPDAAFRVGARVEGDLVRVRWIIADGYYLYRHKIEVAAERPDLVISAIALPSGVPKNDPYLGAQEIYLHQVEGTVAYKRLDFGAHPIQIKVTYQGCAEAGLCYLPIIVGVWAGAHVYSSRHAAPIYGGMPIPASEPSARTPGEFAPRVAETMP